MMTDTELTPNTFDTMKNRNQFIAGLLKCKSYYDIHSLICKYPKYHKYLLNKYHLVLDTYRESYVKLTYKNGFPMINTDVWMGSLTDWVNTITTCLNLDIDTFRKLNDHFDKICDPEE